MNDATVSAMIFGFVIGYGLGLVYASRHTWLWRIKTWLPVRCPVCKHWRQRKHMTCADHRAAGRVIICDDCYSDQYHPFTETRHDHR